MALLQEKVRLRDNKTKVLHFSEQNKVEKVDKFMNLKLEKVLTQAWKTHSLEERRKYAAVTEKRSPLKNVSDMTINVEFETWFKVFRVVKKTVCCYRLHLMHDSILSSLLIVFAGSVLESYYWTFVLVPCLGKFYVLIIYKNSFSV